VSSLATLFSEVEAARARVLAAVDGLTHAQSSWKPAPDEWSIVENLEHLVLAEHSGVEKIYRALEAAGRLPTGWPGFAPVLTCWRRSPRSWMEEI